MDSSAVCARIEFCRALESETRAVAIFGKTWDLHVEGILGITLAENIAMIRESVTYLKDHGREVIYDAEHFFDGYHDNPEYAVEHSTVNVETSIFDVKTERMIWSAISETFDPQSANDAIQSVGMAIIDNLKEAGLMPPQPDS